MYPKKWLKEIIKDAKDNIKMKDPKKVKQGKRNRINGANFERKVRADLEAKGWHVMKYTNNLKTFCLKCEVETKTSDHKPKCPNCGYLKEREYIVHSIKPASPSRFRLSSTGYPDFIACRTRILSNVGNEMPIILYEIIFVEVKINGYLRPLEKEKAKWYLENNICSKFLIAKKIKNGRKVEVEYKEFTYT